MPETTQQFLGSGGMSPQEFLGTPPASKPSKLISGLESDVTEPFRSYWREYSNEAAAGLAQVKKDIRPGVARHLGLLGRAIHGLKTGLDVGSYLFSPATSLVQEFGVKPSNDMIGMAGGLLKKVTPQTSKEPWAITHKDIDTAVKSLQSFNEIGQQTALMMVGGEGAIDEGLEKPPELPEEIGGKEGKPHMRITGVDEKTGKPRVRISTPEQASAHVAAAMKEMHSDTSIVPRTHPLWQDWHQLDAKMAPLYEQVYVHGKPVRAHAILDSMIPSAGPYTKPFLAKLRQRVPDIQIHFVDNVWDDALQKYNEDWLGAYTWHDDPERDHIQIKVAPDTSIISRTIAHELVHAATSRFIVDNPDHPLVRELTRLWSSVPEPSTPHYGLTNVQEFAAEAMTNPKFQDYLTKFKIKGYSAWSGLASIVRRMLGLNPGSEENLLHSVMKTTSRIMEEQSQEAKGGLSKGVAAMSVKAPEVIKKSLPARKLAGYINELQHAIAPESLSDEAKAAGAVIASRISERMARTESYSTTSAARLRWWNQRPELTRQFLTSLESGKKFDNPELEAMRQSYKIWNEEIYKHETEHLGIDYSPRDHYIMHIFENQPGLENFLNKKFGKKWGNPRFIKDRMFNLYDEAIKAGFKPKYTNPEEIMLARQLSSDLVDMQVNSLRDLEKYGLAIKKTPGMKLKAGIPAETWRSPNGDWYFVHPGANSILHNAFESRSLWSQPGALGDAYRGAMGLKNAIVGPRLALSLFHALHVIHIDNMDAAATAVGDALAGKRSAVSTLGELVKSGMLLPRALWENPRAGSRLVNVFKGKVPANALTATDVQNLQFMLEGGFVPKLSDVYKTTAIKSFKEALSKHSARALWHLPGAVLSTMQKPIFEVWIPNLKAASYMRSVESSLARDPSLLDDRLRRQLAFRKIAKSVDNRYGEMSYNTLFWHTWIKDLATLNTLSLGWQLGFLREYGGGALDLGQFAKETNKVQAIRSGLLDRPLFVAMYTSTALGYGGLLTWAMTGHHPQSLMDYVYPQVGQNTDGSPKRVNTMFYTREFGDLYKHMRNEGMVSGLTDLAESKSSGLFGLMGEWAKGVNDYGQEIRDPNAPAYKQVEQTLHATLKELEPISIRALRGHMRADKSTALSFAGFTPAPSYVTETPTESRIKSDYFKYSKGKVEPYVQAQTSKEFNKLRQYYEDNDPKFYDTMNTLETKYGVTREQVEKMIDETRKGVSPSIYMFSHLPWQIQKGLLDKMDSKERDVYLPHSNATHLRRRYE